jgi:S-adenosylmethionine synthetase
VNIMAKRYIVTSESVAEGHPDKLADQISDAILDAILEQDPQGRVACEVLCTTGLVLIAGEISTTCYVDVAKVARRTIKEIGYTKPEYGFHYKNVSVLTSIHEQSQDIALGVDESEGHEEGAGDQGLMYGYATNETPELMPLPIVLSHKLMKKLSEVRKIKTIPYLGPDGKGQVSVEYQDDVPLRVTSVVVSNQHSADVEHATIREDIIRHVIKPICGKYMDKDTKVYVNPTGRFVFGGPAADTGLTGRKIIVDTYGGVGRHGGGAFSGKDPTKVDRSANYMARYIAKNIVGAGLAQRCEVQLAYAIGVAEPVSLLVDTFNTGKLEDERIVELVKQVFPTKPKEIIELLKLRRPIYKKTACYGAFGRDEPEFTWEKTDKAEELKKAAGL